MTQIADGKWTAGRSASSSKYLKEKGRAVARAKQRLINAHRDEYKRYLDEEMRSIGLVRGVGRVRSRP